MRRLRELVEDGHVHRPARPHGDPAWYSDAQWSVVLDGEDAFVDCIDCARRFPEQTMVLAPLSDDGAPHPKRERRKRHQHRCGRR